LGNGGIAETARAKLAAAISRREAAGCIAANDRRGEAVGVSWLVEAAGVEPNRTLLDSVSY